MKELTGEKYIYFQMAFKLAQENGGTATIGNDNGMKGGHNFYRRFSVQEFLGKLLLTETKSSSNFAEFSRVVEVLRGDKRDKFFEYINTNGDNCFKRWEH